MKQQPAWHIGLIAVIVVLVIILIACLYEEKKDKGGGQENLSKKGRPWFTRRGGHRRRAPQGVARALAGTGGLWQMTRDQGCIPHPKGDYATLDACLYNQAALMGQDYCCEADGCMPCKKGPHKTFYACQRNCNRSTTGGSTKQQRYCCEDGVGCMPCKGGPHLTMHACLRSCDHASTDAAKSAFGGM